MAPGATGSKSNVLPLWGNDKTMNLNNLILTNIQSSHYFKVNLFELKTYHEVIDEIYYKVNHLEPWEKGSRKTSGQTGMCGGVRGVGAGGIVSTAFCLLYKLFTLKLTRKQVNGLITHCDSPYIRALGFMYVRFTQPPADLWDWFEAYLDDDEELDVKAGGGCLMTIAEMLRNFMTKLEWYSTLFPRIPVPIQKDIERKLNAHGPLKIGLRSVGPANSGAVGVGGSLPGSPGGLGGGGGGGGGSGDQKERHIPDEEVSWGEAERIARLRRSASREKKSRPSEDWRNGDQREREHKEEDYGRERSHRREKDYPGSSRDAEKYHSRSHRQENSRESYDQQNEYERTRSKPSRYHSKERSGHRTRSRSRDKRSRSHSREHHSKDRHHKRPHSHEWHHDRK